MFAAGNITIRSITTGNIAIGNSTARRPFVHFGKRRLISPRQRTFLPALMYLLYKILQSQNTACLRSTRIEKILQQSPHFTVFFIFQQSRKLRLIFFCIPFCQYADGKFSFHSFSGREESQNFLLPVFLQAECIIEGFLHKF